MRWICFLLCGVAALHGQLPAPLLERHKPKKGVAFEFAAIGDQQYGAEGERKFPALRAAINKSKTAIVIHVGDVKSGEAPCTDAMFEGRVRDFNAFEMPFILTPGDNDWTDCHRKGAGGFDPLERLAHLRRAFYPDDKSFGKRKLTLSRQSAKYPENAMWSMGATLFATIHVVGSQNNLAMEAEFRERTEANREWIRTAFGVARTNGFASVVFAMQANPGWTGTPALASALRPGFRDTIGTLGEEAARFAKPVLVIMGDSHTFRIDQPLRMEGTKNVLETLQRLEVPGHPQVHWVRVRIDPKTSAPFTFAYEPVVENFLPH